MGIDKPVSSGGPCIFIGGLFTWTWLYFINSESFFINLSIIVDLDVPSHDDDSVSSSWYEIKYDTLNLSYREITNKWVSIYISDAQVIRNLIWIFFSKDKYFQNLQTSRSNTCAWSVTYCILRCSCCTSLLSSYFYQFSRLIYVYHRLVLSVHRSPYNNISPFSPFTLLSFIFGCFICRHWLRVFINKHRLHSVVKLDFFRGTNSLTSHFSLKILRKGGEISFFLYKNIIILKKIWTVGCGHGSWPLAPLLYIDPLNQEKFTHLSFWTFSSTIFELSSIYNLMLLPPTKNDSLHFLLFSHTIFCWFYHQPVMIVYILVLTVYCY